jgi:hypothetical protein
MMSRNVDFEALNRNQKIGFASGMLWMAAVLGFPVLTREVFGVWNVHDPASLCALLLWFAGCLIWVVALGKGPRRMVDLTLWLVRVGRKN